MKKKARMRMKALATDRLNFAAKVQEEYATGPLVPERGVAGIGIVIHEKGDGPVTRKNRPVSVHYVGMLASDGSVFDESWSDGRPFKFFLGRKEVISGWDIGIALLGVGDRATLFLPPELGYGAEGDPPDIPPRSELIFYVEVMEVN